MTDPVPAQTGERCGQAGVVLFHGRARFVGPTTVEVGADRLIGRHVLIATGAMPMPLPFPGREHVATSEQFMELAELPRRIVFVGGGYISFEFAHVAAQAGAQITILHRGPRPLEAFDPDLVDLLVKRTRELGMAVELSTEVRGVERNGGGCTVRATREGREQRFEADLVVHGAGRIPELDDLDLEAAGVKREARGVTVNQYLQSMSNPAVYAAGDAAASGPPLSPVASHHVDVVTTNLLQGNRVTPNYEGLASAVFTIPPLASAGLSEAAARQKGLKFRSHWQDTSQWLSTPPARRDDVGRKGTGGRGHGPHPGCASIRAAGRRGDQRVRGRNPLRRPRRRSQAGFLCLPDRRVGPAVPRLTALRTKRKSHWLAPSIMVCMRVRVRPELKPSTIANADCNETSTLARADQEPPGFEGVSGGRERNVQNFR